MNSPQNIPSTLRRRLPNQKKAGARRRCHVPMEHSLRMNYRIRARVRPQGEGGLAVVLDRERAHAVLERRWLEVEPHLQERVDRGGGVALARRRRGGRRVEAALVNRQRKGLARDHGGILLVGIATRPHPLAVTDIFPFNSRCEYILGFLRTWKKNAGYVPLGGWVVWS